MLNDEGMWPQHLFYGDIAAPHELFLGHPCKMAAVESTMYCSYCEVPAFLLQDVQADCYVLDTAQRLRASVRREVYSN